MNTVWTVAISTLFFVGVNTLIWGTAVAVTRVAAGRLAPHRVATHRGRNRVAPAPRFRRGDVAVLMAAHNEAAVLADTLRAASALLPPSQIHVISDPLRKIPTDAVVHASVENYLRAHPSYWRRLPACVVWADPEWDARSERLMPVPSEPVTAPAMVAAT